MVVAIKRRHRGIGDDITSILTGFDTSAFSDFADSAAAGTATPAQAQAIVPAGIPSALSGGSSSSSSSSGTSIWGGLLSSLGTSLGQGLTTALRGGAPAPVKPVSSGPSTALVVGIGAAALVGVVLLMRGRSAS